MTKVEAAKAMAAGCIAVVLTCSMLEWAFGASMSKDSMTVVMVAAATGLAAVFAED